jgi:hypothetical protein
MAASTRSLVLLAACLAVGCSANPPPPSSSAPEPTAWKSCYAGFSPSGDARDDVRTLGTACGSLGGMKPITPVTAGTQGPARPPDRFTFFVPQAGHCFRVFAAADREVRDLDVLILTLDGEPVAGDITHDSWPIVPPLGPACFEEPGVYALEVSVFRGSGGYALQVWAR